MAAEPVGEPDWPALETKYPPALVDGVRETLERRDSEILDPALLGPSFQSDVRTTTALLEEIARLGALALVEVKHCGNCDFAARPEDEAVGICPNCGRRYEELDPPQFRTKHLFRLPAGRQSRDVSWVITAHGMNTDGPWQQDFSWIVANKLKYSAPILILKYPIFRVLVVFERTQRLLVTDLGRRLAAAIGHARQRGAELKEAPDVVLHSYGTLLFARLLLDPAFSTLKFGRVILAGSIVQPNYEWAPHIKSGRIEEVVAHCGDKDGAVLAAEWIIPGSGPSGRVGFVDQAVRNVRAAGYDHGTFFEIERIKQNLAPGGVWDRFLTYPPDQLAGGAEMSGPASWSPNGFARVVRGLLKVLAILGVGPLVWFVMQLWAAIKALLTARA